MNPSHFRELEVWQLAMALAKQVYGLMAGFPREERYGLAAQLQRAAVSIPSNIAEGNARTSTRDYARFVFMALGSTAELQTQLLLSEDLEWGTENGRSDALALCDRVGQMLARLHQALTPKIQREPRSPQAESRVPSPDLREINNA